jgi:hypothetical protein
MNFCIITLFPPGSKANGVAGNGKNGALRSFASDVAIVDLISYDESIIRSNTVDNPLPGMEYTDP